MPSHYHNDKTLTQVRRACSRVLPPVCVILFFLFSSASLSAPLSDLAIDSLEGLNSHAPSRNPFAPGAAGSSLDVESLNIEGIILGPAIKLGLVSGNIVREGEALGNILIKDIQPGGIWVQSLEGRQLLSLEGFVPPADISQTAFEIAFKDAQLKDALKMIATAGDFNIIIPDNLAGQVSLAFHDTHLKDALGSILRVNQLEFAEENSIVRVGRPENFEGGAYFDTKHIDLHYATASTLVETIKSHLSEKGTVTADTRTNTLMIKDSESVIENVVPLIERLDQQDTQLRIEAKIVDVTRSFSRSLGIQWGLTKNTGDNTGFGASGAGNITGTTIPANINLPAISPTSGMGLHLGSLINSTNLDVQITAAESKGDAHILSQPSITTVNNTPAKIRSGVKIYVKATSTITVGGSGTSATGADTGLKVIETGIELTVTPQITSDNTIKLIIQAEESAPDFTRTVDGIPAVVDNKASTTVLVEDGETTVIGGLMKTSKSNTTKSVPFIAKVPVFGWLFKSNARSKTDNELLIFITPRLVQGRTIAMEKNQSEESSKFDPHLDEEVLVLPDVPSQPNRLMPSKYRR